MCIANELTYRLYIYIYLNVYILILINVQYLVRENSIYNFELITLYIYFIINKSKIF